MSEVHLVVFQHGLWGKPRDISFVEKMMVDGAAAKRALDAAAPELHTFNCDASLGRKTYDGIDICAARLVHEMKAEIERFKDTGRQVTQLSFLGYSLGGCIIRYAVGLMHAEGFFKSVSEGGSDIDPMYFITIASPHLGSWRLPSEGLLARAFNLMVPVIASRSGYQLMLQDTHGWGRPLLVNMADPQLCFYAGLTHFKKLVLMSSIRDDRSVPYCTASIQMTNPFEDCAGAYAPEPQKYPSVFLPFGEAHTEEEAAARQAARNVEPPKRQGAWMMVLFVLLLPILLPLMLIMLCVESARGLWHFSTSVKNKPDMEWLEKTQHQSKLTPVVPPSGGGATAGHRTSVDFLTPRNEEASSAILSQGDPAGPKTSHPFPQCLDVEVTLKDTKVVIHEGIVTGELNEMRTRQAYMVTSLSTLPWIRIDVDTMHRHAHASVVLRPPAKYVNKDHLEFLFERVLELGAYS